MSPSLRLVALTAAAAPLGLGCFSRLDSDDAPPRPSRAAAPFTGPLCALESEASTRVFVFSKTGAAVELSFTCP